MLKTVQKSRGVCTCFNEAVYSPRDVSNFIQNLDDRALSLYDSYVLSTSYHEFTGRLGLWSYFSNDALVVSCVHPNDENKILVFPEIGEKTSYKLTFDILHNLIGEGNDVQLARFTSRQKSEIFESLSRLEDAPVNLIDMQETKLDWIYPIYVIDTGLVNARVGGHFEQLRQRLRKIDKGMLDIQPMDIDRHKEGLLEFVSEWSSYSNHEGYTKEDLIGPTRKLLDIMQSRSDNFSGQVIFIDGKMESYCLWEKPFSKGFPANELAVASNHKILGLSEWQIVSMCEDMQKKNIQSVNLGGSETHGLDRFKRKFGPTQTLPLYSLKAELP